MRPLLPSPSRRRTTTTTTLGLAALLLTFAAPHALAATPAATATVTAGPQSTRDQLTALAAQAAAALETYQQAQDAQAGAEAAAAAARVELEAAQAALEASRREMGSWASQAYRSTGGLEQLSGVMAVLDPQAGQKATSALATVEHVGGDLDRAVETHERAQEAQAAAYAEVEATVRQAEEATAAALAAKTAAEALVQQQLLAYSAEQRGAAGLDPLVPDAAAVERARTFLTTAPVCAGGALTGFANGQLPVEALCPLYAAPDKVLRADAAHAFEALSQAFQAEFGTPLAVTDAYRSLAGQIDVKARKPGLAATPGTSRHGWGLAVDLGGGVQDANSVQHAWLDRNAALFGFINPAWAQGSPGPFEPWHWEYVAL
ncbi:M15 family metallopeptidase [Kineococcus sp. SYSU DK003]|uniref:M15 family metallopeptidase n=1 Tax=Kineococcus sp. SYSU DK003 TaxID=3383124 RepID=UPI003D7DC409